MLSSADLDSSDPCAILFHIPKTAGQSLHNIVWREYRHERLLDTGCGLLTRPVWRRFTDKFGASHEPRSSRYRVIGGHMRFGLHEQLDYPARYLTMLRDPVQRFISYFHMLQRIGVAPPDHQLNPRRPDWNLRGHETLPRELDNGQVRALANADWDLPLGACTEEHLKIAQANLDRHFAFIGMSEHFDLSVLLLKRLLGWRWHFYVPKNISPVRRPGFSPQVLDAMEQLNRFDRRLCAHATEKLFATAQQHGLGLQLEKASFTACNFVHARKHRLHQFLKARLRPLDPPAVIGAATEPRA